MNRRKRLKDDTYDHYEYPDDMDFSNAIIRMLVVAFVFVVLSCSAVTYGVMTLIDYLKTV